MAPKKATKTFARDSDYHQVKRTLNKDRMDKATQALIKNLGGVSKFAEVGYEQVDILTKEVPIIINNFTPKQMLIIGDVETHSDLYKALGMYFNPSVIIYSIPKTKLKRDDPATEITKPGWIGPNKKFNKLKVELAKLKQPFKTMTKQKLQENITTEETKIELKPVKETVVQKSPKFARDERDFYNYLFERRDLSGKRTRQGLPLFDELLEDMLVDLRKKELNKRFSAKLKKSAQTQAKSVKEIVLDDFKKDDKDVEIFKQIAEKRKISKSKLDSFVVRKIRTALIDKINEDIVDINDHPDVKKYKKQATDHGVPVTEWTTYFIKHLKEEWEADQIAKGIEIDTKPRRQKEQVYTIPKWFKITDKSHGNIPTIDDIMNSSVESSLDTGLRNMAIEYLYDVISTVMSKVDMSMPEFNKNWIKKQLPTKTSYDSYVNDEYKNWVEAENNHKAQQLLYTKHDELITKSLKKLNEYTVDNIVDKLLKKYPNLFKVTAYEASEMIRLSGTTKPLYVYIYSNIQKLDRQVLGYSLIASVATIISNYMDSLGVVTFDIMYERVYTKELSKARKTVEIASKESFIKKYGKELKQQYKAYEENYNKEKAKLLKTDEKEIPITYHNKIAAIKQYKENLTNLKDDLKENEKVVYESTKEMTIRQYLEYLLLPTVFLGSNPIAPHAKWANIKTQNHHIKPSQLYKNTMANYFPEFMIGIVDYNLSEKIIETVQYEIDNILSQTSEYIVSTYIARKHPGIMPIIPEYGQDLVVWDKVLSYNWMKNVNITPQNVKICYADNKFNYLDMN